MEENPFSPQHMNVRISSIFLSICRRDLDILSLGFFLDVLSR